MAIGDPPSNLSLLGGIGAVPDMWAQINQDELKRQLYHNAQQAQQAVASPSQITPSLSNRARELFLKRLGGIRAEYKVKLGDFVQCHVHADQVFVFFCFAGKEGVVKEQLDLFPSDMLITQFRMIIATTDGIVG
jgi:hypothetical protein